MIMISEINPSFTGFIIGKSSLLVAYLLKQLFHRCDEKSQCENPKHNQKQSGFKIHDSKNGDCVDYKVD